MNVTSASASSFEVVPELEAFAESLRQKLSLDYLNPRDIAKLAISLYTDMYFTHEDSQWYRWSGNYYENYTTAMRTTLLPYIVEVARLRTQEEADANDKLRTSLLKRLYSFSGARFPHDIESLMRDMCLSSSELFDEDSSIVACSSGILDRREAHDGNIVWLPHDPSMLITKCIPLSYDPAATCPEWESFVASSFGDSAERLQVMWGFALAGDNTKKKRIVNLIGPTDTGKSTAFDLIGDILAPYVGAIRTEEIITSRHNAKFDFHGLRNSRLAFVSEPDQHSRFRIAELKRITGGETITTEGKGTAPVRWRASCMLFIGTNYEINFDSTDEAFQARSEYVYCQRDRPIDRELKRKLLSEKRGIFNWLLQGVLRYFAGELNDTPASIATRQRAEIAVEPPLQFIEYAIEEGFVHEGTVAPSRYCKVGALHTQYVIWHHETYGERSVPYGRKRFSEVVQRRFPTLPKSVATYVVFEGLVPGKSQASTTKG